MDFFNGLQSYISGLSEEQWWYVVSMVLLAFILGLLIAYILRGFTVRRYRKALLLAERSRADYETQYLAANEKQKKLAADLAANSQAKVAAMDRAEELASQLAAAQSEQQRLQSDLSQLQATVDSQAATIVSQKQQIETFQAQPQAPATPTISPQEPQAVANPMEDRLAALEARLAALQTSPAPTEEPAGNQAGGYHQPVIEQLPVEPEEEEEPLVIRADTTDPGLRQGENGQTEVIVDTTPSRQVELVNIPDESDRDDLKLIKNIGPFLEEKLHEQGIFTFRQIAGWDAADIEGITTKIGYLPGRIATDDWVGQAQNLASVLIADVPDEKPPKGFRPDNLKVVDGIGPKIEGILKDNEIKTLADLAEQSVDDLKGMLEQAGNRYRIHDPSSWPQQAALARDGQWVDLKAVQDAL
ncbi:MAG: helix-hairpin-helix domain-containing protein [Bacteroidota bacterium]